MTISGVSRKGEWALPWASGVWNKVSTEYYGEIPSAWWETSPPPTNLSRLKMIVIVNLINTGSNMFVLKVFVATK